MITIREEGGQVLVSGSYEETFPLTGKLRNRGFSWDSYRRAWSAPRNKLSDRQLENLRDLIGGREQQVASTAQQVREKIAGLSAGDHPMFTWRVQSDGTAVLRGRGGWMVEAELRAAEGKWDRNAEEWRFPSSAVMSAAFDRAVQAVERAKIEIASRREKIHELVGSGKNWPALGVALAFDGDVVVISGSTWEIKGAITDSLPGAKYDTSGMKKRWIASVRDVEGSEVARLISKLDAAEQAKTSAAASARDEALRETQAKQAAEQAERAAREERRATMSPEERAQDDREQERRRRARMRDNERAGTCTDCGETVQIGKGKIYRVFNEDTDREEWRVVHADPDVCEAVKAKERAALAENQAKQDRARAIGKLIVDQGLPTTEDMRPPANSTMVWLRRENSIYGGGDWVLIEPDEQHIWYVQGNGADGDDWSRNNLPGAIGRRGRLTPEISALVTEHSGWTPSAQPATKPGLSADEGVRAMIKLSEPQASFLEIEIVGRHEDDDDPALDRMAAAVQQSLAQSNGKTLTLDEADRATLESALLDAVNAIADAIEAHRRGDKEALQEIGGVEDARAAQGLYRTGESLLAAVRKAIEEIKKAEEARRAGELDPKISALLKSAKLTERQRDATFESAMLAAGYRARLIPLEMYVYKGNSYGNVVFQVTANRQDAESFQNSASVYYRVTPGLDVFRVQRKEQISPTTPGDRTVESATADERLDLKTEAGQVFWGKTLARLVEMAERFVENRPSLRRHFDSSAVAVEAVEQIIRNFGLQGASEATMRRYFKEAAAKQEQQASRDAQEEMKKLREQHLGREDAGQETARLAPLSAREPAASRLTARQRLEQMIEPMRNADQFRSRRARIERAELRLRSAGDVPYLLLVGETMFLAMPDDAAEQVDEASRSTASIVQEMIRDGQSSDATVFRGKIAPVLSVLDAAWEASESDPAFRAERDETARVRQELAGRGLGPGSIEWPSMPDVYVAIWIDRDARPVRKGQRPNHMQWSERNPMAMNAEYLAVAADFFAGEREVSIFLGGKPLTLGEKDAAWGLSAFACLLPRAFSEQTPPRASLILS